MDPPIVYIEREPLMNMIMASIETFKRECLGDIFGIMPSRDKNYFVITNALPIQLAKKRKNLGIEQSGRSKKNMRAVYDKYPRLFPCIGDFHSHPEFGSLQRLPVMSDTDIADMINQDMALGIVIKISSVNKERILWESASGGGVRGSLGKYKFHINAIRIIKDNKQQCLVIQAKAALRSLNRALGYY